MRILTLVVSQAQAGRTVKSVLFREFGISAGLAAALRQRRGAVCVNGRPARVIDRLAQGDVLTVDVGDPPARKPAFEPVFIPLDILYEDEDFLVVDKPAGLPVHHSGAPIRTPPMGEAMAHYLGPQAVFHPVNRLDKGVSGAMVVAKSRYMHERLRRLLHTPAFEREYVALVSGAPHPPAGVVDAPIARGPDGGWHAVPGGAPCATRYETLGSDGVFSLVRIFLLTGRTHQVRIHMAHVGCPLAGDVRYGGAALEGLSRLALHSCRVRLMHPLAGVWVEARAPVPPDMAVRVHALQTGVQNPRLPF